MHGDPVELDEIIFAVVCFSETGDQAELTAYVLETR